MQLLGIQTTMSHFYCDVPKSHCDSSWCWLEPLAFPELWNFSTKMFQWTFFFPVSIFDGFSTIEIELSESDSWKLLRNLMSWFSKVSMHFLLAIHWLKIKYLRNFPINKKSRGCSQMMKHLWEGGGNLNFLYHRTKGRRRTEIRETKSRWEFLNNWFWISSEFIE